MKLEVETKVKVNNVPELRNKIKKIAIHEKTESRGDDYFALKGERYPRKAFRIRYDGKKFVVNFKKHLKNLYSDGIVVKEEYEFRLTDIEHIGNFLALLEDLGFKPWVKKRKHTEAYLWKKDKRVNIELNHVEHIGTYMEIEFLATKSQVPEAKKKILEVLKELEIKKSDIDNVGYTKRLYEKGIKDRKYFITKKFKKKSG
jgi:predicted adenylyl cyclase CyaB